MATVTVQFDLSLGSVEVEGIEEIQGTIQSAVKAHLTGTKKPRKKRATKIEALKTPTKKIDKEIKKSAKKGKKEY